MPGCSNFKSTVDPIEKKISNPKSNSECSNNCPKLRKIDIPTPVVKVKEKGTTGLLRELGTSRGWSGNGAPDHVPSSEGVLVDLL